MGLSNKKRPARRPMHNAKRRCMSSIHTIEGVNRGADTFRPAEQGNLRAKTWCIDGSRILCDARSKLIRHYQSQLVDRNCPVRISVEIGRLQRMSDEQDYKEIFGSTEHKVKTVKSDLPCNMAMLREFDARLKVNSKTSNMEEDLPDISIYDDLEEGEIPDDEQVLLGYPRTLSELESIPFRDTTMNQLYRNELLNLSLSEKLRWAGSQEDFAAITCLAIRRLIARIESGDLNTCVSFDLDAFAFRLSGDHDELKARFSLEVADHISNSECAQVDTDRRGETEQQESPEVSPVSEEGSAMEWSSP